MSIEDCIKGNHDIIKVFSIYGKYPGVKIIVRWCKECGCIVGGKMTTRKIVIAHEE